MLLRVLMSSAYAPVYTLQEVVGEKDPKAGPKVMRHTVVAPLPMVEKTSQGVLEVPEKIQCWKGSVFSIFKPWSCKLGWQRLWRPPSDSLGVCHSHKCAYSDVSRGY